MPFLIVDYNAGAGGEGFCAGLSQSPQCEPLRHFRYENGRTKVFDVFDQEFLKPYPKVDSSIKPHPTLYTIVPTHLNAKLASEKLDNVRSIRISDPVEPDLWAHVKNMQIQKTLLSKEPTAEYFLGIVKILSEIALDKNFVKKINRNMLNVELILLAKGIDPTPEAIETHLDWIRNQINPDPIFDYDLTISYEDLVYHPEQVKNSIESTFNLEIVGDWLNRYAEQLR
jgi:hypothetical protein